MNKPTLSKLLNLEVTKSPVKRGDVVELVYDSEIWATAKVVDPLSKQFTCVVNGKVKFFFYEDRGTTWQTPKE